MLSAAGSDELLHAKTECHNLSRPLGPTERIDLFISHSWYDDSDAKLDALQKVGKDFRRRHFREPTYWFDKACIDQRNIADGLRVLPLTVMACTAMLVLCGETYIQRLLFCAVYGEMFTLMAFTRTEDAAARIQFVSVARTADADSGAGHVLRPQ